MAIENFIPEIWSAGVTTAFQKAQVVIPTLNTQYSGDARKGNQVNIIGAITPTVVDYKNAGRTISAEALSDTSVSLLIDQEKAFSFKVDDVDMVQAAGSMDAWTRAAGGALAEDAEAYVLNTMLNNAGYNAFSGSITTADDAKAALRAIRKHLTLEKVPAADRYVAVTPAFADLLISGLSDVAAAGSDAELRNGVVGRLYGLTILETPLMPNADNAYAIGYHAATVAFVSQIDSTESLRDPNSFSDIVRGLNVYGAKVVKNAGVVVAIQD